MNSTLRGENTYVFGIGRLTDIYEETEKILAAKNGSPFLFVGSGFSRRYLGAEDWRGLLARFCESVESFDYYFATANGDYPKSAELVANDFHEIWWKNDRYTQSRDKYSDLVKSKNSALKIEISEHLSEFDLSGISDEKIQIELELMRGLNVDGIITTNWDFLLEEIFPEYRVFVGQEQLLFSNPQAIAEIYKIHGCASEPDSLVLTRQDYDNFQDKNPYLAAKLITLFIEHPIFFIGYSVTDPHIQSIIFSIAACLGPEKLERFSENLIFLRRAAGRDDSCQKFTFSEGGRNVVATVLETDDFGKVYSAIDAGKRKIPARILRYCKEQMYELVQSQAPERSIALVSIDELDSSEEVEFVVGVGVAQEHAQRRDEAVEKGQEALANNGYKGVEVSDLYSDFTKEASEFDAPTLLRVAFPLFQKTPTTFIPVFRYLRDAGITTADELAASPFLEASKIAEKIQKQGYQTKSYHSQYQRHWQGSSTAQIISGLADEKIAIFLPFQNPDEVQMDELKKFIDLHHPSDFRDPYSSFYRKLCCFYDRIAYGFDV